jgi:hypothetical protein
MVTIGGIPVYDAIIADEESGMLKISLVDEPAVMSDFLAFDATKKMLMYSVADEERRLVYGVVMRADFPIYRRDDRLGEYYIIYKAETIRQMAEKYLAESRQNDVSTMHTTDVDEVRMVQYFIKDTARGVSPEGFDDIADGSLFAEFHVLNDEVWAKVKDGTYKGFSLEGLFDLSPERNRDEVQEIVDDLEGQFQAILKPFIHNHSMSKINRFKAALAKMLAAFGNVSTDKGILAWDGDEDLKEGDAVYIEDQDGNRTPAEDGEYVTSDAKTVVVSEGKVAEIRDPEAEVAPEPEAAPEAEAAMGRIATDAGELVWEGEEDLKAGDEVFVEGDEGLNPAPDGEYKTEDGKTIVVVEGKVAEIRDPEAEVAPEEPSADEELRKENEELRAQVKTLTRRVEELSRQSAAKPAHEEVKTTEAVRRTGIKGLDRLAELMGK